VEVLPTKLEGPILLQPKVFRDERGFFLETYRRSAFGEVGIEEEFVQDNHCDRPAASCEGCTSSPAWPS
jgi:dTDP-4-dehydrorhamnose 3,5-epimerase